MTVTETRELESVMARGCPYEITMCCLNMASLPIHTLARTPPPDDESMIRTVPGNSDELVEKDRTLTLIESEGV